MVAARAGGGRATGPGDEPVPRPLNPGVARELAPTARLSPVWDVQGVRVPSRGALFARGGAFEPNFFVLFPEGPLDDAPQTFVLLSRIEDPTSRATCSDRWSTLIRTFRRWTPPRSSGPSRRSSTA